MIDSQSKKPFELLVESKQIFVPGVQKEIVESILTRERIFHFSDYLIRDNVEPFTVRTWVFIFETIKDARRAVAVLNAAPETGNSMNDRSSREAPMEKWDPSKEAAKSHEPHTSVEEFERALHKHLPSISEPPPGGMDIVGEAKELVPVPISDEEMDVLENYEAPDHLQRILETLHQKGLNPEEELPPDLLERYHSRHKTMSQPTEHPYLPSQAMPSKMNNTHTKILAVVLKVFAYVWLIAAALLILVGIIGTWIKGGFSSVQKLMSPFNIVNYVLIAITLAPGIAALAWADRINSESHPSK